MKKLPLRLPDSFEKALGYNGKMKWVAFYWTPDGDEAVYDDGFTFADGNWHGFLAFIYHPSVAPHLKGYDLGSSESTAKHWLLADLEHRAIWVGDRKEVAQFLEKEMARQLSLSPPVEIPLERLQEIIGKIEKQMRAIKLPSMKEIEKQIAEEAQAVEAMLKQLDTSFQGPHLERGGEWYAKEDGQDA